MKTWMLIAAALGFWAWSRGHQSKAAADTVEQGVPRDGGNWVTDQWRMLSALDFDVGQSSASTSANAHPSAGDTAIALNQVYR